MNLGTYADGRNLEYDEGTGIFRIGDVAVTAALMRSYVDAGQINWASPELAAWFDSSFPALTPATPPARRSKGLIVAIVAGSILVACALFSVASAISSSNKSPETTAPATQPAAVSETATSETAAAPEPVAEPEPAPAPEPAPEPTPAPQTSAKDVIAGALGTFRALEKDGSGAAVVSLPSGATAGILSASHRGSSNFAIQVLDENNASTDLLVNTIGAYSGTTLFGDQNSGSTPKRLKIEADGPWSIKVSPASTAKVMGAANTGRGDSVLLYDGPAADFIITHKGSSNFAVDTVGGDGSLLVNEIGDYSGTVPVGEGPMIVKVIADGKWTITVRKS